MKIATRAIQLGLKAAYKSREGDRLVVSLQSLSKTKDSIGGYDGSSYAQYATAEAIVTPTAATRSPSNEQHENTITDHVRIPYDAAVKPGDRVVLTGKSNRILTIQTVINSGEQDTYLHLECEELT